MVPKRNKVELLLSATFMVEGGNGEYHLNSDEKILNCWKKPHLSHFYLEKRSKKTDNIALYSYEIKSPGTYEEIFSTVSSDYDSLCLTQDQIFIFIKQHHNWLREMGQVSWFLFKEANNLLVADVQRQDYKPSIGLTSDLCLGGGVGSLDCSFCWDPSNFRQFIIVPKIVPELC